ncbi:hypothetical protein ACFWP5_17905 [Streptomyces sp. NPDC058469]|uniref:hypothetical protein n=1 Tax=Streptomyces sp. NPDC058469 TaxID=3346514 RepID=UPI003648B1C5
MAGRIARWGLASVLGAVWWWAVLRLALTPHAGALEGAVAAGGWGLSLLPVHCMPKARAAGAVATGRWREAWRVSVASGIGMESATGPSPCAESVPATKASPRHRSDGGSGPS